MNYLLNAEMSNGRLTETEIAADVSWLQSFKESRVGYAVSFNIIINNIKA